MVGHNCEQFFMKIILICFISRAVTGVGSQLQVSILSCISSSFASGLFFLVIASFQRGLVQIDSANGGICNHILTIFKEKQYLPSNGRNSSQDGLIIIFYLQIATLSNLHFAALDFLSESIERAQLYNNGVSVMATRTFSLLFQHHLNYTIFYYSLL